MKINDLFGIEGKVAVISGGSRGIGEMIAAGFLANGVNVCITPRKEKDLHLKAEELMGGAFCFAVLARGRIWQS